MILWCILLIRDILNKKGYYDKENFSAFKY